MSANLRCSWHQVPPHHEDSEIRTLREERGGRRLIMADGFPESHQRGFGILNGIESDGCPRGDDWSGGIDRHRFWKRFGTEPTLSYTKHAYGGVDGPDLRFAVTRFVFAGMVLTDGAVAPATLPEAEPGATGLPVWDELEGGMIGRLGWLAEPRGEPVRRHRGDRSPWHARLLTVSVRTARWTPEPRMTWLCVEPFDAGFFFSSQELDGAHEVTLVFEVEGGAPIAIDDPEALTPGVRYRRLVGSARQDPGVNDGAVVQGAVELGAKDGLFLRVETLA